MKKIILFEFSFNKTLLNFENLDNRVINYKNTRDFDCKNFKLFKNYYLNNLSDNDRKKLPKK